LNFKAQNIIAWIIKWTLVLGSLVAIRFIIPITIVVISAFVDFIIIFILIFLLLNIKTLYKYRKTIIKYVLFIIISLIIIGVIFTVLGVLPFIIIDEIIENRNIKAITLLLWLMTICILIVYISYSDSKKKRTIFIVDKEGQTVEVEKYKSPLEAIRKMKREKMKIKQQQNESLWDKFRDIFV